eukprot:TRINITY_DN23566_c0_g1_i1.p1 TRINITY_DN23566_c0_g1~~TRINITY_DN23566_c0_g1_i1.p1  ORF type:complete len:240 (+),score=39.06 TRINITY_DN23566_c0_g1_i1:164-883(+)
MFIVRRRCQTLLRRASTTSPFSPLISLSSHEDVSRPFHVLQGNLENISNIRTAIVGTMRCMSEKAQIVKVPNPMAMSVDALKGSPLEYRDPLAWSPYTTDIAAAQAANLMVNRIMMCGKKATARRILSGALRRIHEKTGKNPLSVLQEAIQTATPCVRVKSRRVGSKTCKVPNPIRSDQGKRLAIRWIVEAARKRTSRNMDVKLSEELMDAARGNGEAVRKKDESHKIAMTNRAFAHFR